ncbi:MAG: hypothetical protein JST89_10395 [Cyanobacteria bacterium SZAS-4]|nr:hypothetical protein [Cyanobacteria bacterium SZAS-4]
MGFRRKTLLLIAIGAPWYLATASFADTGMSNVVQATTPDLGALERRYFGRVYDKDSTDKRIQRIELLLFGATQDGGMVERLDRIQQSAAEHAKAPKSNVSQAADTASIAVLERKILKKSFDAETPSQRLGRLESKVFGQPTPSMSVGDRVFRLKKILNVETPSISRVPMPSELGGMGGINGMGRLGIGGLGLDGDPSMPFGSFTYVPFAGGNGEEMAQQMNEMIKQLNKSLRGIHRLPDGAPNVSPFTGPSGSPFSGPSPFAGPNGSPFTGPNGTPFVQPFRTAPQQGRDTELPPYLDPNSI